MVTDKHSRYTITLSTSHIDRKTNTNQKKPVVTRFKMILELRDNF